MPLLPCRARPVPAHAVAGRDPALRLRGHLSCQDRGQAELAPDQAARPAADAAARSWSAPARPATAGPTAPAAYRRRQPRAAAGRSGISPSSGTSAPTRRLSVCATAAPPPAAEHLDPLAAVRAEQVGHVLDHPDDALVQLGWPASRPARPPPPRPAAGSSPRSAQRRVPGGPPRSPRRRCPAAGRAAARPDRPSRRRPGTAAAAGAGSARAAAAARCPSSASRWRWPSRRAPTGGMIICSTWVGRPVTPSIRAPSARRCRRRAGRPSGPAAASATARLTVTEDLPTPALAAGHRVHLGQRGRAGERDLALRLAAAQLALQLAALLLAHHVEFDPDRGHAGQRADGAGHVAGDGVAQRAAGDRQPHVDPDRAVGGDLDVLDHPQFGDGPPGSPGPARRPAPASPARRSAARTARTGRSWPHATKPAILRRTRGHASMLDAPGGPRRTPGRRGHRRAPVPG